MSTNISGSVDRRSPGTSRIPFDAMVEVGGALGPSFEAQAVNLSEGGMHLRTAYLPEIGQELHCRFDAGPHDHIMVTGEVLWREDFGSGGEFGIRFREIDPETSASLERICGFANPVHGVGSRVRLHIDGLSAPMRARIRDVRGANIVAYSELGFLQMGRPVELEDASTGERRPAHVDQVEVELDGSSRVPQLVVSMKYDDDAHPQETLVSAHASRHDEEGLDAHGEAVMPEGGDHAEADPFGKPEAAYAQDADRTTDPGLGPDSGERFGASIPDVDVATDQSAAEKMRGAVARTAHKVGPALTRMAARSKTALALLWAKRKQSGDARRVTAPPPQGVLHSSRGKVTRDSFSDGDLPMSERAKEGLSRHKSKVAAGVILLGVGIIGLASIGGDSAREQAAVAGAAAGTTVVVPPPAPVVPSPIPPVTEPTVAAATPTEPVSTGARPQPFTNGSVTHPKVLRIKMDGPIEKLQGAAQPSGFVVTLPGRKSLEGLSGKDTRIERVKLNAEGTGTEVSVAFKDGVPNYVVRAKGDVLEIALDQPKGKNAKAKHGKKKGHKH